MNEETTDSQNPDGENPSGGFAKRITKRRANASDDAAFGGINSRSFSIPKKTSVEKLVQAEMEAAREQEDREWLQASLKRERENKQKQYLWETSIKPVYDAIEEALGNAQVMQAVMVVVAQSSQLTTRDAHQGKAEEDALKKLVLSALEGTEHNSLAASRAAREIRRFATSLGKDIRNKEMLRKSGIEKNNGGRDD
jgi:hypothetical protein